MTYGNGLWDMANEDIQGLEVAHSSKEGEALV
jgi:hypothetical protein